MRNELLLYIHVLGAVFHQCQCNFDRIVYHCTCKSWRSFASRLACVTTRNSVNIAFLVNSKIQATQLIRSWARHAIFRHALNHNMLHATFRKAKANTPEGGVTRISTRWNEVGHNWLLATAAMEIEYCEFNRWQMHNIYYVNAQLILSENRNRNICFNLQMTR